MIFILIFISAALVNNFVFSRFLGICPFLGVSKKIDSAIGMGLAVIFVMVLSVSVTWPLQNYVLNPLGISYLQTITFILVIASLVQLVEMILKKNVPALYHSLGIYLPLITTNCAILGIAIDSILKKYSLAVSLVYALGAGIGFTLALVIMAGIRERLETADPPAPFRGTPLNLILASLLSMAFMGFSALVNV
ncbi:electron transport complex subunit RsxA [candidate division WOR-3 bacterium]|nr:electron transport complex subunit RsxA [candidate division WOR-3 bacterium]